MSDNNDDPIYLQHYLFHNFLLQDELIHPQFTISNFTKREHQSAFNNNKPEKSHLTVHLLEAGLSFDRDCNVRLQH